jgi:hypothetical protein
MATLMRNGILALHRDIKEQDWIFLASGFGSIDDDDDDLLASMDNYLLMDISFTNSTI